MPTETEGFPPETGSTPNGDQVTVSRDDLRAVLDAWGRNVASAGVAAAYDRLSAAASRPASGPGASSGATPMSLDRGEPRIDLSASPQSCMWCLWDITRADDGRWRLAWGGTDDDGRDDPYYCDGSAEPHVHAAREGGND
jgi:hypothetical protein